MTLSDLSIRNHVFAWMLMAAMILFGAIGYARLGVSQNPDVDFPVLNVAVTLEGASPEVIETDVIEILEDSVVSVEGVRSISSTAKQGRASLTVEFDLKRDIDLALQDVQTRIAQAARLLPREIDPPVITKTNPEDQPILWLNLSGHRPQQQLAEYIRNVLKPAFQTLPGVGEVTMGGYLERNIRVWLDARRMESYGLTADDVVTAIQDQHIEVPAGRIESGDREMNVRSEGEAIDVSELAAIVVAARAGAPIRLGDVAVVEDGLEDKRRIARALGQPALGMGIRKQRGSNAVDVAHAVKARLEEVRAALPKDMTLAVNFDGTTIVEEAVHEIQFSLLLAALLTGFVCWAFLGSWTSTVNILLAIPTSIIGTFLCMYFFGFTLNTFTLLGLSLSVGIVVDDAIMVLENIVRHREAGLGRVEAALVGAREITFAAMAATAAITAVFLPVAFMKGIIGRFFFEFGVTISVAVLLSLLEALTLTPMRCSQFLETSEKRGRYGAAIERLFDRLARGYGRWLGPALRHRGLVMIAAGVVFVASLGVLTFMRRELVPSQDLSRFMMRLQTPVGSSVDYTDRLTQRAEAFLASRGEVYRYFTVVGGFGQGGDVNTANAFVTLLPKGHRPVDPETGHQLSVQEFMGLARRELNAIPGLRAVMQDLSQQGFSAQRGFPVELAILGPDWDKLASLSSALMDRMRQGGMVTDVDTDYQVGMPEVEVRPDRQRAADLGISMASIGSTVNTLIGGARVARFKDGGRRYDIRVRLQADQRRNPDDIRRLLLRTGSGGLVRLGDVVTLEERPTLQIISHRDRRRAIGIFANLAPGASQAKVLASVQKMGREMLPEGYSLVLSGSAQAFQESFDSLVFALVLGLVVAYMILASQFNSFTHPIIVLLALPFSVSGALLALALGDQSLNIYSMIGLILLMGIAKKNSIILVDFTNQLRRQGLPREAALLRACPIRLRPILMTSISTIAGAVPAALALGPGAETRIPMSLAVIGGITVSTFMTLFVVPAGYSLLDDLQLKFAARRRPVEDDERVGAATPAGASATRLLPDADRP
ncbi:MAG TPA: efflux RND transporter permease subunit [Dongiaceae bacterium]|nr:efflux RND transporter permease subunit [Dongiaceae bacterium]